MDIARHERRVGLHDSDAFAAGTQLERDPRDGLSLLNAQEREAVPPADGAPYLRRTTVESDTDERPIGYGVTRLVRDRSLNPAGSDETASVVLGGALSAGTHHEDHDAEREEH
jgi:hypothetical protein